MHFIGMLAWQPPFPLYYALGRTAVSILAAIAASCVAMHITNSRTTDASKIKLALGALFISVGISGMHYIGMSALLFSAPVEMGQTLASDLVCYRGSGFVLCLGTAPSELKDAFGTRRQVAASLVLGCAICGMHYSGMHAMMLQPGSFCIRQADSFSGSALARIGVGNAMLFTVCLLVVFQRDKLLLLKAAAEAQLEALEATRNAERLGAAGKIAASIAHEINNPLEAVTNLLYLVEHGDIGDSELGYLHTAQDELRRIAEITTHTLKFYKQQSAPTRTALPELFESALVLFAKRFNDYGITVNKSWDPKAPLVTCLAGEIRQVLANLIGNAIDAMPHGGVLELSVRAKQDGAEITVADTGYGMSQEVQKRIFEPFFTTKGVAGTGLGLSICAEILERHGGSLRLRSETDPSCSGTEFSLFLPANGLQVQLGTNSERELSTQP